MDLLNCVTLLTTYKPSTTRNLLILRSIFDVSTGSEMSCLSNSIADYYSRASPNVLTGPDNCSLPIPLASATLNFVLLYYTPIFQFSLTAVRSGVQHSAL